MTQKELEIAQAACCVGKIWDEYEGTKEFNEMVWKRVQHLIELVRNHLESEQPEVDLKEEIASFFSKNPIPHEHITDWPLLKNTALHFFNLGLNARREQPEGGCSEKPNNLLSKM